MKVKIEKWGNYLGIRIPSKFVKKYNLEDGSIVEIIEGNGRLYLKHKTEDLNSLVKKINASNIHKEISFGKPEGKEVW